MKINSTFTLLAQPPDNLAQWNKFAKMLSQEIFRFVFMFCVEEYSSKCEPKIFKYKDIFFHKA